MSGGWRIGDAGRTIFGPKTDEPAPVVIATLPGPTARVTVAERAVIVRLIRAAPDLLHLLTDALLYVEEAPTDGYKPGKGPKTLIAQIRDIITEIDG